MKTTLIIGYGNLDREDDGVAWHVLAAVAAHYGRYIPGTESESSSDDEPFRRSSDSFEPDGSNPDLMFRLQLTPELAELVAGYERVCFVDAHTGAVENDLNIVTVDPEFQASPFTHHMTAATLLSFAETLYGAKPEALLVSVRGYQFRFRQSLSESTRELAEQAATEIIRWIKG